MIAEAADRNHARAPVLATVRKAGAGSAIGVLQLNSPQTLNALSLDMIEVLGSYLKAWARLPELAMVVLHSGDARAFCAGGDIQYLHRRMCSDHAAGGHEAGAEVFFEREYRLDYLLHRYPKPVLCWGNGIVMGGGLGLFSASSHRVVTDNSFISFPEIGIGLFPDAGVTGLFADMPMWLGLFLGLTGAGQRGADALHNGVAAYLLPQQRRDAVFAALEAAAWTGDAKADHGQLSAILREAGGNGAGQQPPGKMVAHLPVIKDFLEGVTRYPDIVTAILALADVDPWFAKPVATLRGGCPASAGIIVEQIRRAPALTLEDQFRMEMVMASRCARNPDFVEGIRARLIDKDNRPGWRHPDLLQLPWSDVLEHFDPPWESNPLADISREI